MTDCLHKGLMHVANALDCLKTVLEIIMYVSVLWVLSRGVAFQKLFGSRHA